MKIRRIGRTFGSLLRVYAFFFLIPLAASLWLDDDVEPTTQIGDLTIPGKQTTLAFAACALTTFAIGATLASLTPPKSLELRDRESYFIVAVGWLVCAFLGAAPFVLIRAAPDFLVAYYESMSGLTTTGFSALPLPLEQYAPSVHVWRATQHLFGGFGIVLVAIAVLAKLTQGGAIMVGGEAGGQMERLQPKITRSARSLFEIYFGLIVLAFISFLLAIRFGGPGLPWKESTFEAYVHAAGAVATGGFSTRTNSIAAFESLSVSIVAIVFMFLGALSFPLFFRFFRHGIRVFWQNSQFRFLVGTILGAIVGVAAFLLVDGASIGYAAANSVFYVMTSIATCGFTLDDPNLFPDGAKFILVFLMFTGGMVGSTAGAIKVDRIEMLLRMTYYEVQRLLHPRAVSFVKYQGQLIPEFTQRRVTAFFFSYVTIFIAGALGLMFFGFDFSSSIVGSAASLGAAGFGWGEAANGFADPSNAGARGVSIVLMWMGRLEIFTALLIFLPATYRD